MPPLQPVQLGPRYPPGLVIGSSKPQSNWSSHQGEDQLQEEDEGPQDEQAENEEEPEEEESEEEKPEEEEEKPEKEEPEEERPLKCEPEEEPEDGAGGCWGEKECIMEEMMQWKRERENKDKKDKKEDEQPPKSKSTQAKSKTKTKAKAKAKAKAKVKAKSLPAAKTATSKPATKRPPMPTADHSTTFYLQGKVHKSILKQSWRVFINKSDRVDKA